MYYFRKGFSIATGALKPKTAVALSASLNLVGAFLSVEVARSVSSLKDKIRAKILGLTQRTDIDHEQSDLCLD